MSIPNYRLECHNNLISINQLIDENIRLKRKYIQLKKDCPCYVGDGFFAKILRFCFSFFENRAEVFETRRSPRNLGLIENRKEFNINCNELLNNWISLHDSLDKLDVKKYKTDLLIKKLVYLRNLSKHALGFERNSDFSILISKCDKILFRKLNELYELDKNGNKEKLKSGLKEYVNNLREDAEQIKLKKSIVNHRAKGWF